MSLTTLFASRYSEPSVKSSVTGLNQVKTNSAGLQLNSEWTWVNLAEKMGISRPIPTLASNSKHGLDKELQIHRPQVPATF
jgi:hypothetical protein